MTKKWNQLAICSKHLSQGDFARLYGKHFWLSENEPTWDNFWRSKTGETIECLHMYWENKKQAMKISVEAKEKKLLSKIATPPKV